MYNSQEIAENIKQLAKAKGISINQLLINCGLHKNILYTMQKSGLFPRTETLAIIADYLGCSVDYLLGRTTSENDPPIVIHTTPAASPPTQQLIEQLAAADLSKYETALIQDFIESLISNRNCQ